LVAARQRRNNATTQLQAVQPNISMTTTESRIATSFAAQGLMITLGASLVHVGDGEVHIALPFAKHLSQQHGYVHAGAITSILDSACGYAALTKAPPGMEVVTAEFKINLMRPALGERFLAVGRVQSAGKLLTVCTGEVRAFSGNGDAHKVVALMQATMVFVAPR
jgi:uncharacterized protein (TIGR00369 family)